MACNSHESVGTRTQKLTSGFDSLWTHLDFAGSASAAEISTAQCLINEYIRSLASIQGRREPARGPVTAILLVSHESGIATR